MFYVTGPVRFGVTGLPPICISSPSQRYWQGATRLRAPKEMPTRRKDAMSMRRLIGIYLACLVTSACAIDKTTEESTSHPPGDPARFSQENGESPTGESARSAESLITTVGSPTI